MSNQQGDMCGQQLDEHCDVTSRQYTPASKNTRCCSQLTGARYQVPAGGDVRRAIGAQLAARNDES